MIHLGDTVDGKKVMGGVYSFYETYGISFDILFTTMVLNNQIPAWEDLYNDARTKGMGHKKLLLMLEDAISDSYGIEMAVIIISKLKSKFGD